MEKGEDATTWGWGATASKEEKKNPCVCYSPPSGQSVKSSTIIAFKAREEASQSWKKLWIQHLSLITYKIMNLIIND